MSVTSVDKDLDGLTLTLVAEFDAPPERVWELWSDPRKLERWWGPPGYPATVEAFDMRPGGEVGYVMTGPEGERYRGWWRFTAIDAPTSLEFVDGFADEEGVPNETLPTMTVRMRLDEHASGTRMELRSAFDSREDMEWVLEMGAAEGMLAAMSQMDLLLDD
jgi:uncharacterized protein YndB with AHSA1/START domain